MNSVGVPTPQGRLRVLVVGPAPAAASSRGGMATVIALMAAHPDPRIHITAVPTFIDGPLWPRLMLGVRGMLRATWLVLRRRTDVLHVHLAHGGSVIRKAPPLLAARLTGTPAIVHAHSYDFGGWFDQLAPPARAAVRRMLAADHWVVLGERHVQEYASRLRLPTNRISVLPNAVRIPNTPVNQLGVQRVHAVALGRLGVRKGSYDLIDAVAALDETVRNRLLATLAGDGDVAQVRAAVAKAGLGETIDVVGWLDPTARDELLCRAQIFVLPSRNEGLPMALLEAMANGLAPVTTTAGSIGEVVTDGVNGLLVGPAHADQLAHALGALVTDENLRARLGGAARERAGEFGLDRWYQQLTRLWASLAGDPHPSRR
ncbi:glycosyltransferase family 4 protein [Mycobacterium marinum]|uniref:glycosyltransferase family 4 protein n=1 Tax=Mycobacterium marinum TaxID=1781 RepID=UPI00356485A4